LGNHGVLDFFTQKERNCSFSSHKRRKVAKNARMGKIEKMKGVYLKIKIFDRNDLPNWLTQSVG